MCLQRFQQRHDQDIREEDFVLCMIDDVSNLLRKQLWINGVAYHAASGNAVIELHVAIVVPGERANPIAKFCAERSEHLSELATAFGEGFVVLSMARVVDCN